MKTVPMAHQREAFETHKDSQARAHWWDPGTGKTKVVIDTACWLFQHGKIQGLFVLAPSGVHRAWATDELPAHAWAPYRAFVWETSRKATREHKAEFEALLATPHGCMPVLCMTYAAFTTEAGALAAKKFLTSRRCLYAADETSKIKTPSAKITKRVLASARYAPYRRALNGTPVSDSPFQAYSQVQFLDAEAWRRELGITNFSRFKGYFGIYETKYGHGRQYPSLTGYRNLERLNVVLAQVGERIRKDDVLDLPPKTYVKRYFDLSKDQRDLYEELRHNYRSDMFGGALTVESTLARITRLQQVAGGFAPTDEEKTPRRIGEKRPRVEALLDVLEEYGGKAIVWARFTAEVDEIAAALKKAGISYVRYDGEVAVDDRRVAKDEFTQGDARIFLSKTSCAGHGLTLIQATTVIYYSNNYSLDQRQQSEDRAHRKGQTKNVTYIDIVANDTVDQRILECLRTKQEIAGSVTGDAIKLWI
jgi:SNF2 family DNA or RNA helicase